MNSLRLPTDSPSCVAGEAPAKMSTGTRPLEALWSAPPKACVPHSTCTITPCARPETWANPWAAVNATISFGHVMTLGKRRLPAGSAASASMKAVWSLPRLANTYSMPVSHIASSKAAPVVCMGLPGESNGVRVVIWCAILSAAGTLWAPQPGHDQLRARRTLAAYGFRPDQMSSAAIGPRTAPTVTIE